MALLAIVGLGAIMLGLWGDRGTSAPLESSPPTGEQTPGAVSPPRDNPTSSSSSNNAQDHGVDEPGQPGTTPGTLTAARPLEVEIPSIGVRSTLLRLGLAEDGSAEVPTTEEADQAGWYRYSPTPGELGPAVIIGHVDSEAGPAVFHRLEDLTPGETIRVPREDGSVAEFTVDDVESFAKETFPTQRVYGDINHAGLRLITCGGDYDRDAGGYQANTVVFATLVQP